MRNCELDMHIRVRDFTHLGKVWVAKSFRHHLTDLCSQSLPRNSIANDALVLVHFDEIGLAEASPNNPLKVLHAHLEPGYPKDRPEPWTCKCSILLGCAHLGLSESHYIACLGKMDLKGAIDRKPIFNNCNLVIRLLWNMCLNSRCCYRLAASPRIMPWLDYPIFHWMQPRWIEPSRWYVHLQRKTIWWRRRRQFATWWHLWTHRQIYIFTSSTARGGGGSFKKRKTIGVIGCCESQMSEQKHWPTD